MSEGDNASNPRIPLLVDGGYNAWRISMAAHLQTKAGQWWPHAVGDRPTVSGPQQDAWDAQDIRVRGFIVQYLHHSQHHHIDGWLEDNWSARRVWEKLQSVHERVSAYALVDVFHNVMTQYQDGTSMAEHITRFREQVRRLTNAEVVVPQEALCALLLCSLPGSSWKGFIQGRPRTTKRLDPTDHTGKAKIPAEGWTLDELIQDLQAEATRLKIDAQAEAALLSRSSSAPPSSSGRTPCPYCQRTNHRPENCWKKFPEKKKDFDHRKGKANVASSSSPSSSSPSSSSSNPLAPERDVGLYIVRSDDPTALSVSSSAVGPETDKTAVAYKPTDGVHGMFVDSGASFHYVPHREWLTDFVPTTGRHVTLADETRHPVIGTGTLRALVTVPGRGKVMTEFPSVQCVPQLGACLLSVTRLTDAKLAAVFFEDDCTVYKTAGRNAAGHPNLGAVVAHARKTATNGRLWRLDLEPCLGSVAGVPLALSATGESAPPLGAYHLWHGRLGHINSRSLIRVFSLGMVTSPTLRADAVAADIRDALRAGPHCAACMLGKSHRAPFRPVTSAVTRAPLELIHVDVCGPFPVQSRGGASYFLVVVDDWTRYVWLASMSHKSQAFERLKQFQAWAEAAHSARGLRLSRIRSDNGGEFRSDAFTAYCMERGIQPELTAAHSPQQNGVAERMNRTLVEGARTLLAAAELPDTFWADAVHTVAYLRNVLPHSLHARATPYERWTGRKPDIDHLRVYGSLAYAHVPKADRNKLGKKARRCVLIGYAPDSRQYRLYDPATRVAFDSRDVTFVEHVRGYWSVGAGGELQAPSSSPAMWPTTESGYFSDEGDDSAPSPPVAAAPPGQLGSQPAAPQPAAQPARLPRELAQLADRNLPGARDAAPSTVYSLDDISLPRTRSGRCGLAMLVRQWAESDTEQDALVLAAMDKADGDEPATYSAALRQSDGAQWAAAGQAEYDSLIKAGTFELVPRPAHRKVIGCKSVCKIKRGADGQIAKYKVRFVARGFAQVQGVDYNETFAPVVRYSSLRLLFALVAHHDWELHHMDVKSAYLNGDLEEEIYMEQPEGFAVPGKEDHVCRLKKSLYGLKQAGRTWHHKIDQALKREGFKSLSAETCIYLRREGNLTIIIALYVDDLLLASSDLPALTALKAKLASLFEMSDLGEASYVLGMEIKRDRATRTLTINQRTYVRSVLRTHGMEHCKPNKEPMDHRSRLVKSDAQCEPGRVRQFQSVIGALMFAAICTRPDIAYAVSTLSQFASDPSTDHEQAVKRVLRYLQGTSDLGLRYQGAGDRHKPPELHGYCDSDWGSHPDDRRSITGYAFLVAGGAVSWQSKRQKSVATSSVEAEYMAARAAVQEAIWWRSILRDLGHSVDLPTQLLSDSQGSIAIANGSDQKTRTKHIDIQYHFTRECVENGQVSLRYIPSADMAADTLTKPLPAPTHQRMRQLLGMCIV
jgi:transposase InsO family protein